MITLDSIELYEDGDEFKADVFNTPLAQLGGNQITIADLLNAIFESDAITHIIKHNELPVITTAAGGIIIGGMAIGGDSGLTSEAGYIKTNESDGSITFYAKDDGGTHQKVLSIGDSLAGDDPTHLTIWQDGIAMFSTSKSGAERILTAHNKRISDVATPTSNNDAANKAYVDAVFGASPRYTSPEFNVSAGGAITATHGLGAVPFYMSAALICKIPENGYSVGDVVPLTIQAVNSPGTPVTNHGIGVWGSATQVGCTLGANGLNVYSRLAGSTGRFAGITPANWRVVLRAQA